MKHLTKFNESNYEMMREKESFIKALNTLFWSFGSEPPSEVIWGANELLEWFEKEYSVRLSRFTEDDRTISSDFNKVIEEIRNL